ncbi:MAG TPA: cation diffusion facilitator family transporter [Gaiellaceae bacterium]|nr:cation diffusion facilitator family transporter [Gaiellaceae bacterium]
MADHGGHEHVHVPPAGAAAGPLARALCLVVAFMAAEVAVAIFAHSLALLSDAAHMLVDAIALGLGVWAARLAARPPGGRMTFGLKRAEILSAQANGITLLLLGLAIVVEAVRRLASPPDVRGGLVLATACAGAAVNALALVLVARAGRQSLNVEGSYRHLLTDLYAFGGTAVAGAVVWTTGFERADPLASLAVAASMLAAGWPLLRRSGGILLEGAPEGVRPDEIGAALQDAPGVVGVHDLHVWEITSGFPALSAHVLVRPGDDCHAIRRDLERLLGERFAITHTTLQVEHARDELLTIRPLRAGRRSR